MSRRGPASALYQEVRNNFETYRATESADRQAEYDRVKPLLLNILRNRSLNEGAEKVQVQPDFSSETLDVLVSYAERDTDFNGFLFVVERPIGGAPVLTVDFTVPADEVGA